jgi:stage II sporulation protein D
MILLRTLFPLFLLLGGTAWAQQDITVDRTMRIGLYRERVVKQVVVMPVKSICVIYADGERKGEVATTDGLRISVAGGAITARSLALNITAKRKLELVPRVAEGGFRLRIPDTKLPERTYPGKLAVTVTTGNLMLVNAVPLEAYTAGVVQAEAGKEHHQEYYKLQAVTCRTYALTNQRKHQPEGFELCDGVHCQVYHGRNRNDSIRMAVDATHSLVLVDADIKLIQATFHSNCGGETVNAEDLWGRSQTYLRATVDTFCTAAPHATWTKNLSRTEWLGYLQRKYSLRTGDSAQLYAVLNYEPQCRDLYLGNTWPLVPLKNVREDLGLKSTFFSVRTEGEKVVLEGRGFGHGVGLCQEGAMKMARAGKSYTDILHHYYTSVHLVDLTTLDFFRDDSLAPNGGAGGPRSR